MASDLLQVRNYTPSDWAMVLEWWQSHTSERTLIEAMLPPLGIVIEKGGAPVMALWIHLSAGVGVAILENPVMAPGVTMKEAGGIADFALEAARGLCETHDYGVMLCYTLPPIARFLKQRGWSGGAQRVQMMKEVRHGS